MFFTRTTFDPLLMMYPLNVTVGCIATTIKIRNANPSHARFVNNMQTHCSYITAIYQLNCRSERTITVNYDRLLRRFQSLNQI